MSRGANIQEDDRLAENLSPDHSLRIDIDDESEEFMEEEITPENSEIDLIDKTELSPTKKRLMGSLLVIFSAFLFSVMTLLVDIVGRHGVPSFEIMVIRCICQSVLSGAMCVWAGVKVFGEPGHRLLPFLRGFFGPIATGALYYGATHIPISDATILKFTSPIWTLLIARVVLGERIKPLSVLAILLGFIGVICVAQPEFLFHPSADGADGAETGAESGKDEAGSASYIFSIVVSLIGAVCSACVYVVVRKSGGSVHYHVLGFYYGLVGIPSSTILLLALQGAPVMPPGWTTWMLLTTIITCGIVGQTCFNRGAQMIEASKSAAFRSTDVGFVLMWQVIFLHEIPTWWSILGICLICTCILIMAFSKKSKEPQPAEAEPDQQEIELEAMISDEISEEGEDDIMTISLDQK